MYTVLRGFETMTANQMIASLAGVGAKFYQSSATCQFVSDPAGAKSSYHISATTPGGAYSDESIVRVFSQAQLLDWVQTQKAAARLTDEGSLETFWEAYHRRWYS